MPAPRRGSGASTHEPGRRALAILLGVSFAVRLAAWLWVSVLDMPALFDEAGYLARAQAAASLLFGEGGEGGEAAREELYGRGVWPPGHPLLLAPAFLFGAGTAGARLIVVLCSFATTWLLVSVTERLAAPGLGLRGARRAGLLAGWVHALHPSFVAYSHLLWAETTFGLLLLLALRSALRVDAAKHSTEALWRSALVGVWLGLAGLVRAAVLPYLLLFPAWIALRRLPGMPWARASIALGASLIVLAPWLLILGSFEGRVVPLSTEGGWNLYLGNNPWCEDPLGSSAPLALERQRLAESVERRMEEETVERDHAARSLAIEEISAHPLRFAKRCLQRLRAHWSFESFLARHLLHAVYPPLPVPIVGLCLTLLLVAHVGTLGCVVFGFAARPAIAHRAFLAAILILGPLPAVLTIGMPRFALPALLLSLPVVGHGLACWRGQGRRAWGAAAVGLLVVSIGVATSLPALLRLHAIPSSLYDPLIDPLERALHVSVIRTDDIAFRTRGDVRRRLGVRVLGEDHWLRVGAETGAERRAVLSLPLPAGERTFDVTLYSATGPPEIELNFADTEPVVVRPVQRTAWRRWVPTGLPDLEMRWLGGGRPPLLGAPDSSASEGR